MCSRQLPDQFLNGGALGGAEGVGIIDERVLAQRHLSSLSRHHRLFKGYGVGLHANGAHRHVLAADADALGVILIAHVRNLNDISTVGGCLDAEESVSVGQHALHHGGVLLEQLDGSRGQRLARLIINYRTRNLMLGLNGQYHHNGHYHQ